MSKTPTKTEQTDGLYTPGIVVAGVVSAVLVFVVIVALQPQCSIYLVPASHHSTVTPPGDCSTRRTASAPTERPCWFGRPSRLRAPGIPPHSSVSWTLVPADHLQTTITLTAVCGQCSRDQPRSPSTCARRLSW